ncbi:MAG: SUMF1/EgtB/PvdO family nonheme iron enzyme, partial [Candidatus Latescibacteria bacterium]|nr:SUMF1/EgtB/PvdO family nonheme iron enzyme [Candidatus Latescibacterota bacterium]
MRKTWGSADRLCRRGCSALAALLASVLFFAGLGYTADRKIKTPDGVNGIDFAAVPGGSFRPGYIKGGNIDLFPAFTVDAFEMSVTEITNSRFCSFLNEAAAAGDVIVSFNYVIGTTGKWGGKEYYQHTARFNNDNRSFITYNGSEFVVDPGKEKWPVVYVTWYGAKAFAEHYGYDLPTETEWEYAAKGGGEFTYG